MSRPRARDASTPLDIGATSRANGVDSFDGPHTTDWMILLELRRIRELLLNQTEHERLVTKAQAAKRLGVSTRWIERHLKPVAQASARGRAWYSDADIERQLASRATGSVIGSASTLRRSKVKPQTRPTSNRAKEIEAELRRDLERHR